LARFITDLSGWKVGTEEFLGAVLESVAQPIWVVDPGGLIRFANRAAVDALGYDNALELLGRPSHENGPLSASGRLSLPGCEVPDAASSADRRDRVERAGLVHPT
jgi:PAS domain-containing protein